ncbi:glycosyltransferase family 4 protein [Faecalibacter sp. LW9]|uniref:glycosyltransferase family 4 protein n=1 Tax=Faecalibacter sp. LW9 TaxID=3103144 RepID=UPI002AFE6FA8|nr:glycosyltransferase family 4 protein [Faecalibacter sp. LW9]
MKLLYITNGINGSGGLERVLSIKASYFAEKLGYEVIILCLNEAHSDPFYQFSEKIRMVSIPVGGNPFQYICAYKNGIQKTVNDIQPDIISVCDDGLKAFFIPYFLKTDAKLIYERHVSKLIEWKDHFSLMKKIGIKVKWFLMEILAKKFSYFVVLTEGNTKEWTSLKNLKVIPNPLSFFPEKSSTLENKVVICVGKISYQKGQDLLVKAWEKVHELYPDWELHLYGKEDLSILDTHHLSHNIHYFPPAKDIEQKYLESSIYVMSSRFEGFGMVLTEAMACGVPCVSFDCDFGPSDIIQHQIDGLIIDKENIHDLTDQLIKLISNYDLRKVLGSNAKINVQKFAIEPIAKQWENLFKLF